ncbi:hypothetical protein KBC75_04595 [Candidatus Shapirobacteria bacterium]|nr:hypothetical protein [Candidatus Shapirobacteria bacterium]
MDKVKIVNLVIGVFFVTAIVFGTGGYLFGQKLKTSVPEVLAPLDQTSDWKTFSDSQLGFSFKYPSRYTLGQPVPGGDAPNVGSYTFYAGSKADMFFFDTTVFSGRVDGFVKKYTAIEPSNGLMYVNLNVSTVLGDLVSQDNPSMAVYKYVNHYDQNVNPGAQDISTYTIFLVQNNKGFVVRGNNTLDNLPELLQTVATIKN